MRYHLDDLGWYEFESLIQALLKALLGFGVEAWGGQGDHGKDAFFEGSLAFPSKEINRGPFVFQVKFVSGANAAGSKVDKPLFDAIRKEMDCIRQRPRYQCGSLKFYTLITNAKLSGTLRERLVNQLRVELKETSIHLFDGADICSFLDNQPNLRKAFPQLLGLKDLEGLLKDAVSGSIVKKSRAAIDMARCLTRVFVPTTAYLKTLETLKKHNFVVLEGPPEMGKTAIAWMISLSQIMDGWEGLICDDPEDFFQGYNSEARQVFVADDAFGTTEYDPTKGQVWECHLEKILYMLNSSHWLVWTSRKHILQRALVRMNLQYTNKFPSPGAVLVDASILSVREKALMLYRHSRSANLDVKAKQAIRNCAVQIVKDPNFTPERIRRLVVERLPELIGKFDPTPFLNHLQRESRVVLV